MLNAGRMYLGDSDLRGRVFVTSGLGGMSGAQAKAAVICGCVGVIAEARKLTFIVVNIKVNSHRLFWLPWLIIKRFLPFGVNRLARKQWRKDTSRAG